MNLLEQNNYRKRGRPYKIPGMLIVYLAKLRKLRGISFTTIYSRNRNVEPEISIDNSGVIAAIDSTDYLGTK